MLTDIQKERIRKWVNALRSGEYKQTIGTLKNDGRYCCLGVACELFRKENEEIARWDGSFFDIKRNVNLGDEALLPFEVAEWYGIVHNPYVMSVYGPTKLIVLNDRYRLTFEGIADLIEATYLKENKDEVSS